MQRQSYFSPLGEILLAADGGALIGLWFRGQKHECAGLCGNETQTDESNVLSSVSAWLDGYFAGERPERDFPLTPRGSEFRQRVWAELLRVPYGETVSYGELGRRIGCASARAIGNAVGNNPISILIPCHRVVGKKEKLTGYAGGVDKKLCLLKLEKADGAGCRN